MSMSDALAKPRKQAKRAQQMTRGLTKMKEKLLAIHMKNLLTVTKDCNDKVDACNGQEQDAENALDQARVNLPIHTKKILVERDGALNPLYYLVHAVKWASKAREEKW